MRLGLTRTTTILATNLRSKEIGGIHEKQVENGTEHEPKYNRA